MIEISLCVVLPTLVRRDDPVVKIKPMDKSYIHVACMHYGPVDPLSPPRPGDEELETPDLPAHPWSDETIVELAKQHWQGCEGWGGDPAREFMREMIQRYGTCAMLAWEERKVVGLLRFYPLTVAHLLAQASPDRLQLVAAGASKFEPDPDTLWVQCVMTCRPYVSSTEGTLGDRHSPSMADAGARKGTGLKLVQGLIAWARERGWKRIVTTTNADLDCFYGIIGKAGRAFWEQAGFQVVGTHYAEWPKEDDWEATVGSQAREKKMSKEKAWTVYHMVCTL